MNVSKSKSMAGAPTQADAPDVKGAIFASSIAKV